ncbi:RagB/SusD family nutrient uptake outer membrane protein [Algoriphagus vanfongensis]|uniref:RagB/SusD family nutrient uptake outer membrane protein n=1 Tax=Algoriphagus vanfongensis TaxID=426371 RepID=UPI0004013DB1|nr:RagB/SusD family nutrient uptake outer membrane protein [Algoriphagus vanfongensis]
MMTIVLIWGCSGFLDERPNKEILIPTSEQDIRSLLDNDSELNLVPSFGLLSSDDLIMTDDGYASLRTEEEQNAYLWRENIWPANSGADWSRIYRIIFIANVVLEQAEKLPESEELSKMKAEAFFHRAHAHFMLAQVFSPHYEKGVNDQDLGIPLRMNSEILERSPRVALQTYYEAILKDLDQAFEFLPTFENIKTRPTQLAVRALQSRVLLTIGEYDLAEAAADWVISRPEVSLLNYESLNSDLNYPFVKYNEEVIFHSVLISHGYASVSNVQVWINPYIIESYQDGDLRKPLFTDLRPNGGYTFKGQYSGNFSRFGGLALDEIYYIKAECLARRNQIGDASSLMNQLLETRYAAGHFVSQEFGAGQELLEWILEEKRKSLVYRGINWIDLRRLNKDPDFQRVLVRQINGETVTLNPTSKKYVLPIPENELALNPISQTDRKD